MAFIKQEFKDRIFERVNKDPDLLRIVLEDFAGKPRHEGRELSFTGPHCGANALKFTPGGKMVYKCFSCNEVKGNNAIGFLMGPGVNKKLQEAIEYICNILNIPVEYQEYDRPIQPKKKSSSASFCKLMLDSSGLTKDDVTVVAAKVLENA